MKSGLQGRETSLPVQHARPASAAPLFRDDATFSCEVFPPRQVGAAPAFWSAVAALSALRPRFISVTSGANGTTRDLTFDVVAEIHARFQVPVAAHLTAQGATRKSVDALAERYWRHGIRRLVALRGDPAADMAARQQPGGTGYPYAHALVAGLRRLHPFDISVAAYPETHPEAPSPRADIEHLKRKLDAGASRAITQFFFDTGCFERFLGQCAGAGIEAEIVPGILPICDLVKTETMAAACGTTVPAEVRVRFAGLAKGTAAWDQVAIDVATQQCRELQALGVGGFHFYSLNRADLVAAICRNLGLGAPAGAIGTSGSH